MLLGQQVGPFVIEKELGAGAMGAVYRGLYTKTGQKVAVKIMLPGLEDNKQAAARFDREVAILKQFNHPNIVRLFGVGKFQNQRYYAMEYIEGESLDRVLARRNRLSWEEVVTLGRQLCAALAHAHQQGVVHRDLKPSNLMILPDGSLKLTDFGIAKDLDVTALTEANCTVGTASYMSPEQCKGERNLTHKSDLYSLGIVFYELLTGRKPFIAENVMDMFMAHVKGTCERPSRMVDIPKWLDTLVCQLMEKKPEQRPLDAMTVAKALDEVLEKVESRQSAGVEVARKKSRSKSVALDDTDRAAADTLLAAKKKKKKPVSVPFFQKGVVQAAGILVILAAVGIVLFLVFRPESQEKIFNRIKHAMESGNRGEMYAAFDGAMIEYDKRFRKNNDEMTRQVNVWRDQVGIMKAEDDLEKTKAKTKVVNLDKMDALSEAAKQSVRAALQEDDGNLDNAAELWKKIAEEHKDSGEYWAKLAEQRLNNQLPAVTQREALFERHMKHLREFLQEPVIASDAEKRALLAWRYEQLGDIAEAHAHWDGLKDAVRDKPEDRTWFLLAASKARRLLAKVPKGKDADEARSDAIRIRLEDARKKLAEEQFFAAEAECLNLLFLYGERKDEKITDQMKETQDLLGQIRKKAKRG